MSKNATPPSYDSNNLFCVFPATILMNVTYRNLDISNLFLKKIEIYHCGQLENEKTDNVLEIANCSKSETG